MRARWRRLTGGAARPRNTRRGSTHTRSPRFEKHHLQVLARTASRLACILFKQRPLLPRQLQVKLLNDRVHRESVTFVESGLSIKHQR